MKMILRAIKRDTSIVTQEGLSRLRYFVTRTFSWDKGINVGPEYIKQAEIDYANGDKSKVDYIGNKEVDYFLIQNRRLEKLKLSDITDNVIMPLMEYLPERDWKREEMTLEFLNKPAREIYKYKG